MKESYISIGKASEQLGVTIQTLRYWEEQGLLVPSRTPKGHRRYKQEQLRQFMNEKETKEQPLQSIVYARVSTKKQADSGNLARQIERLTDYATKKGYPVAHVYKDVASGLNENRQGLQRLLKTVKEQPSVVIVEYKDRLTRFGFSYLKQYIEDFGGTLIVMDEIEKDENQELVEDLIAITTSFSARIYGKRGGKKVSDQVEQIVREGEQNANGSSNPNGDYPSN